MKFALITADDAHKVKFRIDPNKGDATSFMSWVWIFDGVHLSFKALRTEDNSYLKDFDVVMMSGHPQYMEDIARIARLLKDSNAVSMFYPEGSAQLYDYSIRTMQPAHFQAMCGCDILSVAEEDKIPYYETLVTKETVVRFIHVPMTADMESGRFRVDRGSKRPHVVVYGDNNPNHPVIASLCAKAIEADIIAVEWGQEKVEQVKDIIRYDRIIPMGKMPQNAYLWNLGMSIVNFYPTEWIGTARQQISCAVAGTPCIGNHDSHTQNAIFPSLGADIYDVPRMVEQAKRLIEDAEWYRNVTKCAWANVQRYSLGKTTERFLESVETARTNKKRVVA